MTIETYFTGAAVDPASVSGATAVVIDVIRATTTMIEGLTNGARAIYPVEATEEAVQLAASLGREDTLLCGERRGMMIEGFDLGNSPREYSRDVVEGKQLVMTTTNGTRAFVAVTSAAEAVACAFVNLSAVLERVAGAERLVVVCAGKEDRFSLDDVVCAGMLIDRVLEKRGGDAEMNDASRAAVTLARENPVSADFLRSTAAGAALVEVGLGEDLEFVARIDSHRGVPEMRERVIRLPAAG